MTELHVLQLWLDEMNTYGDRGNLLALVVRARRRGLEPVVHRHRVGDALPDRVDVVLAGGGQDSAQVEVQRDAGRIGGALRALAARGVPMLAVCGSYQLFGNGYVTAAGARVEGVGVFDAQTVARRGRLVGNVAVRTGFAGTLYGFENHSGRTHLGAGQEPLGTVLRGQGNNGADGGEGARARNAFGTYLHGPVLPNNPVFLDHLLHLAARHAGAELAPERLDDSLAEEVRGAAARRAY